MFTSNAAKHFHLSSSFAYLWILICDRVQTVNANNSGFCLNISCFNCRCIRFARPRLVHVCTNIALLCLNSEVCLFLCTCSISNRQSTKFHLFRILSVACVNACPCGIATIAVLYTCYAVIGLSTLGTMDRSSRTLSTRTHGCISTDAFEPHVHLQQSLFGETLSHLRML